jgi:hypothetical protein
VPKDLQDVPELGAEHDDALKAYKDLTVYTWQELEAYMRLSGNALDWWEIEAVMTLAKHRDEVPTWPLK